MNNLNSILLEGNLVRDPETRTTTNGKPVSTFQIATNRFYRKETGIEKEVSFFNVEAWGRQAENVNNLGRKGRGVRVVGRLKQERWNGADGKTQSKVVIVAEHIEFRPEFKKNEAAADDPAEESETEECAEETENLVPTF